MATIPEREQALVQKWRDGHIFERSLEIREGSPMYKFYDGPPFATGLPHYGHILASVAKDLVGRYWTMKGLSVPRRWGWDCHGLPIENIVEKELQISGKKQIETLGVNVFNDTCRRNVLTYADEWGVMIERIGRWVDFSGSYKTMDSTYQESVWWALRQLWDKDLIYQGRRVLLYCPRCETPLSNFEVAMDDSYQDVTEETVVVSFPIIEGEWRGAELLAWTTTPWTLPANVALAVGEAIDYSVVKQDDRKYILATSRHEMLDGEFEILQQLKGSDLVGLKYDPLFTVSGERPPYTVAAAEFVSTESGTGIVHIAPAYGEDDFNLAQSARFPVLSVLDQGGKYNEAVPEELRGLYHKKAEPAIKDDLTNRDRLYRRLNHTHSYPFCWRCETPLYYYALPSWFIAIQKVKARMIELNEDINWYPEHLKHGRFLNIIATAPDWNISRNRYWATALPFWICDDQKCGHQTCVGSVAELKEKATNFGEVYKEATVEEMDLHKPYIDQVILQCEKCQGEMHRVPEVVDCWVESGSMPFAEWHYPFANKELVEERLPAHFVTEYIGQTRAWFYYMLALSTILFDKAPFQNVVTTGTILNEKGQKMSKSKSNFPDPKIIVEKYGVDALRLYLMSAVVMRGENLFFAEREVMEMYRRVIQLWYNVLSFYQLYAPDKPVAIPEQPKNILDQWVLSRLNEFVTNSDKMYAAYDPTGASRLVRGFVEDVSTWYVRRSRDRFKDGDAEGLAVFRQVLLTAAQVMAPLLPFAAEETWTIAGGEGDSVHLTDWPTVAPLVDADLKIVSDMAKVQAEASVILSLRMQAQLKVRQVLRSATINFDLNDELKELLADEVNVQKILVDITMDTRLDEVGISAADSTIAATLDTTLDDELRELGLLRELVRAISDRRKQAGLAVKDTVTLSYQTDDEAIKGLIERHGDEILVGVHGTAWQLNDALTESDALEVDGHRLHLQLK